ncbi:MAG: Nucleotidyltransferase/DNA polymerase involved in repair-like protein [Spartobacteria bacterium]|nr:Nucleotidyltransferase/DNA polymerase involved in repair-like protein [Spartobacteria bacterium]
MFATIYVPDFFLQAVARHQGFAPSTPVALIDEKETKAVIIQLNEAAKTAGVRLGMVPSQGLARCLNLLVRPRSPAKEESLANVILQYAFTLSPYVEATASGIWTIQFTDNRDLAAKLLRVIQKLAECEVTAQAGIAPAPDTSFLAAHLARPVLQVDDPEEFLAPLSIDILAIPGS